MESWKLALGLERRVVGKQRRRMYGLRLSMRNDGRGDHKNRASIH